jgi:hypothetical protein
MHQKMIFRGNGTMLRLALIAAFGVSLVAGMKKGPPPLKRATSSDSASDEVHNPRDTDEKCTEAQGGGKTITYIAGKPYYNGHPADENGRPLYLRNYSHQERKDYYKKRRAHNRRGGSRMPHYPKPRYYLGAHMYGSKEGEGKCSICHDVMKHAAGDTVVTRCNHYFHKDCLDNWTGRGKDTCPLCIRPINGQVLSCKPVIPHWHPDATQAQREQQRTRSKNIAQKNRRERMVRAQTQQVRYQNLKALRRRHFQDWARQYYQTYRGEPTQADKDGFRFPMNLRIPADLQFYHNRDENKDDWKN